ncbi:hypothetical protein BC834DRAFT_428557 [Gloeopeniophorella convolvens]|nr:hypothetical protein BC834DRAFT_428557 [Gloeopeniophorella convolvens]
MPWPSAGDAFCDVPAWLTVNASQAAGFNQTSGMYEAPINYLSTPAQHQSLSASHYHTPVSQPPGHELQYTPGGDLPPFPPSRAPPPTPQHLLAPTASAGPPSAPLYWPAQFAPTQTPPARPSSRPMIFASQPPQSPARTPTMYALPPPPAWAPPPRATIPVLARNAGIPKRPHF